MSFDIAKARQDGMAAYGKTWRDCPYGSRQPALRDAWCAGRQEAIRQQQLQQKKIDRDASSDSIERIASLAIILVLIFTAILGVYEVERLAMSRFAEVGHGLETP